MNSLATNAALEELRQRCQAFKAGDQSMESFEGILSWGMAAPRRFGAFEFKVYLAELDSKVVTKSVPSWAHRGREVLWGERDFVRNQNLGQLQAWRRPPEPVVDDFSLVRSWPCYMESLRPFPQGDHELLDRANDVYRYVAGRQCFDAAYSTKHNKYQHPYSTFVICSCVVQFKVIFPIVRELDKRVEGQRQDELKERLERFCVELIKARAQVVGLEPEAKLPA